MSCLSISKSHKESRYLLLEEKLRIFTQRFQKVLYPAIIHRNGEVITFSEDLPPEYEAYIFSMRAIAEKVLKVFCHGNCRKMKIRGDNQALFSLYSLDNNSVLVFYSEIDPNISKAIDPTSLDDTMTDLLTEIQLIFTTSIDVV
jgi:hypothetical protein